MDVSIYQYRTTILNCTNLRNEKKNTNPTIQSESTQSNPYFKSWIVNIINVIRAVNPTNPKIWV